MQTAFAVLLVLCIIVITYIYRIGSMAASGIFEDEGSKVTTELDESGQLVGHAGLHSCKLCRSSAEYEPMELRQSK